MKFMKKRWILLIVVLSVFITNYMNHLITRDYDYRISSLENERVLFSELPLGIQNYLLINYNKDSKWYSIVNLSNASIKIEAQIYEYASWIMGYRLLDQESNISYFIPLNPKPYIVHDKILYIPDQISNTIDDENKNELIFTAYKLKDSRPFYRIFSSRMRCCRVFNILSEGDSVKVLNN